MDSAQAASSAGTPDTCLFFIAIVGLLLIAGIVILGSRAIGTYRKKLMKPDWREMP